MTRMDAERLAESFRNSMRSEVLGNKSRAMAFVNEHLIQGNHVLLHVPESAAKFKDNLTVFTDYELLESALKLLAANKSACGDAKNDMAGKRGEASAVLGLALRFHSGGIGRSGMPALGVMTGSENTVGWAAFLVALGQAHPDPDCVRLNCTHGWEQMDASSASFSCTPRTYCSRTSCCARRAWPRSV